MGVSAVMNDLGAADAVTGALFWYAVFKCAELVQLFIPALPRRTLELRIVNGTRGDGGGRSGHAPTESGPDPDARARPHTETAAARV